MVAKKIPLEDRLLEKIERIPFSGCWIWMGGNIVKGYGVLKINKKNMYVHRLSYKLHKGEIPGGMMICHTCDTPLCVNPYHLFAGTALDNNKDKASKGRQPKGEKGANAKLTQNDIDLIRSIHKKSCRKFGSTALARIFNVSQRNIWMIVNNQSWRR